MEVCKRAIQLKDGERASLYLLGDIHEGAANHDDEAFQRAVAIIHDDPAPTLVVGMGDYCDCIINSQDPRWDPIEIAEKYKIRDLKDLPRKQADSVIARLQPIKDKIAALLVGNHEEAYIKRHSFDVYDHICEAFPAAAKLGYVGMLRITLDLPGDRSRNVDIALNHGAGGGGMREGYHTNKTYDVFRKYRAHMHFMGHLHGLFARPSYVRTINERGTGTVTEQIWHGMTGCFLRTVVDGQRNYFENRPAEDSRVGMLHATIGADRIRDPDRRIRRLLHVREVPLD